jgi:hypothetical protein
MEKITLSNQYDSSGVLMPHKDYGYSSHVYKYKNYVLFPEGGFGHLRFYIIENPKGFILNPFNDLMTCDRDCYQSWIDFLDNRYVLTNLKKCKEFIDAHIQNGENYERN